MPQVTLLWVDLAEKSAVTNGVDTVWLDKHLLQVERRCSLTHELIHIERGHTSCQSASEELSVRAETARRLIPFSALLEQKRWSRSTEELADCLWVTPRVLLDRIELLEPLEQMQFFVLDTEAAC